MGFLHNGQTNKYLDFCSRNQRMEEKTYKAHCCPARTSYLATWLTLQICNAMAKPCKVDQKLCDVLLEANAKDGKKNMKLHVQ